MTPPAATESRHGSEPYSFRKPETHKIPRISPLGCATPGLGKRPDQDLSASSHSPSRATMRSLANLLTPVASVASDIADPSTRHTSPPLISLCMILNAAGQTFAATGREAEPLRFFAAGFKHPVRWAIG